MARSIIVSSALVATALVAGCNHANKPAMTLQQYMKLKVDPTSKVLFNAVQYVSDDKGNHDIVPQTDADWAKVRQAAVDMQGIGKELQSASYTKGRNPDWTKMSQDLVTVAQQMEQATKDKNVDKVFEISGTMYNVCTACHQVYPATVGPEASATPKS